MRSPLVQLLLLSVVVAFGLWVGVKWFLGGTEDLSANIDIRTVGYLRDNSQSGSESESSGNGGSGPAKVSSPGPVRILVQSKPGGAQAAKVDDDENPPQDQQAEESTADDEPELDAALEAGTPEVEQIESEVRVADGASDVDAVTGQARQDSDTGDAQKSTLGADELEARERARRERLEKLGLVRKKLPEPTIAVDVSLHMPESCSGAPVAKVPVGLKFRYETSVIRGESLNALESLVALFRACEEGKFVVAENPLGRADATDTLKQMRLDEVKYFFIQHSVSIDTVEFPKKK